MVRVVPSRVGSFMSTPAAFNCKDMDHGTSEQSVRSFGSPATKFYQSAKHAKHLRVHIFLTFKSGRHALRTPH
jgi:hypothetical protein